MFMFLFSGSKDYQNMWGRRGPAPHLNATADTDFDEWCRNITKGITDPSCEA
jgi:hypothetical protein